MNILQVESVAACLLHYYSPTTPLNVWLSYIKCCVKTWRLIWPWDIVTKKNSPSLLLQLLPLYSTSSQFAQSYVSFLTTAPLQVSYICFTKGLNEEKEWGDNKRERKRGERGLTLWFWAVWPTWCSGADVWGHTVVPSEAQSISYDSLCNSVADWPNEWLNNSFADWMNARVTEQPAGWLSWWRDWLSDWWHFLEWIFFSAHID